MKRIKFIKILNLKIVILIYLSLVYLNKMITIFDITDDKNKDI